MKISHEQMRKKIGNIFSEDLVDTQVMTLDYIKQHEKQDKLLGLYREYYGHIPYSGNPRIKYCELKIDELEKEIEEELE